MYIIVTYCATDKLLCVFFFFVIFYFLNLIFISPRGLSKRMFYFDTLFFIEAPLVLKIHKWTARGICCEQLGVWCYFDIPSLDSSPRHYLGEMRKCPKSC